MNSNGKVYDITIIGGGPAGLFTAFYGGMRQCSVKIIDSMPQLGGQLAALYPEKYIYDAPGFPKITAQELVDRLIEQASIFNPTVALDEKVIDIVKNSDGNFEIITDTSDHVSKSIIITAGVGAFEPRRLEIEKSLSYEGKNLHYFINDMNQFAGKKVIVFGGGDSAVDWALMLEPIAEQVTLVHRRDRFRAHESSVETLMNSSVNIMTPFVPTQLIGEDQIQQVVLKKVKSEEETAIEVDDVIVNYGFISTLGPIQNWGLDIDKGSIVVNSKGETNIPGIYAAGDITTYPGKVKLIATGFGEGPTAVNNAKAYIDPDSKVQPLHSTSMKAFNPA
ncbi:NAD(P)/FAD-dependent oxidoreductase [Siminovitchia acidinfaciens]|uniref:Ferredoxin--NADP reductase n=1 Tax=Siminovitchia acidinfaciens TaxID=2321395 RepID=A0A429Y4X3_9BACI|nr:NAD(P)/FAD-dependent oxidoreductase [Siminovitchia acidinfaciens]RST76494.1 NAD(P)/FAD-dependent oxidoreductase [Siminovitchia acidinfaciens]